MSKSLFVVVSRSVRHMIVAFWAIVVILAALQLTTVGFKYNDPGYYMGQTSPNGHAQWLESEGMCMIHMKRVPTDRTWQWVGLGWPIIGSILEVNEDYIWCTVKAGLHE